MASLVPIITSAVITQGAGLISNELAAKRSRREQDVALHQLRQQQDLQEAQLTQDAALDRQRIALEADNAEEDRKSALRRAVARQRANFGSQGVSAAGGSAQAVLLGLFEESDEERQKREKLDALRFNALDQDLAQRQSLNVLQRTQLQERQNVSNIAAGERVFNTVF